MAVKNYMKAVPLTSVNSATFTGAFVALNGGLQAPCVILRIINSSNREIDISYDGGATAHDHLFPGERLQLDFQANAVPNTSSAAMAKGTVIYVRGAAGAGLVYLAGYYQPDIS